MATYNILCITIFCKTNKQFAKRFHTAQISNNVQNEGF